MHLSEEYKTQISARFDAVLISEAGDKAACDAGAGAAVTLAGGRIVISAPFGEAVQRIAGIASRPLVLKVRLATWGRVLIGRGKGALCAAAVALKGLSPERGRLAQLVERLVYTE